MKQAILFKYETPEELAELIAAINKGYDTPSLTITEPPAAPISGEVDGDGFEKLMANKGYKVTNLRTKKLRCKMFGITMTKRGKSWWYKKADIDRIPVKRGKM